MSSSRTSRTPSPPRELVETRERISELLARVGARLEDSEHEAGQPTVDVWSTEEQIVVELELPGVSPEHLSAELVGLRLTVRGEPRRAASPSGAYHRLERTLQPFDRTIELPGPVDGTRADCRLTRGVLSLRFPRARTLSTAPVTLRPTVVEG